MNTTQLTPGKNEYLLLMRGHDWHNGYSVEEIQTAMTTFQEWFQGLEQKGLLKGARPLQATGKIISGKSGRHVSDGPFAESKEAIGGYIMITAASLDEATAIAKSAPMLDHGVVIELRQLADECPVMEKLRQADA
jgi:hypothetical protein